MRTGTSMRLQAQIEGALGRRRLPARSVRWAGSRGPGGFPLPGMLAVVVAILSAVVASADVTGIPRLPPGQHLTTLPFGYFEEVPDAARAPLENLLAAAVARGMRTVSYELDWSEIETAPGIYDLAAFEARLDGWAGRGLTLPYLNISAISIGALGAPADLLDPDDPLRFVDGRRVDDPLIVGRYLAMLDAVVPVFLDHGGWVLMAGNEVDDYFKDVDPSEAMHFVSFLGQVRGHVRSRWPDLPVGVILTSRAALEAEPWLTPILQATDVAGFNFYAGRPDWTIETDPEVVRGWIRQLAAAAGDRPILIQELGAPSSYEDRPTTIGCTLEQQATLLAAMADEISAEPRFRWVSWFTMVPFSDAFADAYVDLLASEPGVPQWFLDRFREHLRGYGLARFTDGTPKPAWSAFLDALEARYRPPPRRPAGRVP